MFILLIILIILIIVGVIWLIKNVIEEEPHDEWYSIVQKEPIKSKNNIVQKESAKSLDDISREYNENLRKIEQERVKNGFYEIPKSKHANNSLDKTKTAYDLLLECPEWKKFRKNIIEIKGKQCEWCATNKNLQVHHKYYLKTPDGKYILPWRYNINALLVLCKNCHEKAHKKYKIKSYYTNY